MGVFCLSVSEIENLLLTEEVLRAVAVSLNMEDVNGVIAAAEAKVFSLMESTKDALVSGIVAARIEDSFSKLDAKAVGCAGIRTSLDTLVQSINVEQLFQTVDRNISEIIERKDYRAALQIYSNKGLVAVVSSLFDFKAAGLLAHIRRLLASKDSAAIVEALRSATPQIA